MAIHPNARKPNQPGLGVLMLPTRFPRWLGDTACGAACARASELVPRCLRRDTMLDAGFAAGAGA
jgi:hypothetical protein